MVSGNSGLDWYIRGTLSLGTPLGRLALLHRLALWSARHTADCGESVQKCDKNSSGSGPGAGHPAQGYCRGKLRVRIGRVGTLVGLGGQGNRGKD